MRKVRRSALVPHSAKKMFLLVDDVETYPDFLPWCNDSEVHKRCADTVEATLELHKGALSNHFTTRNTRREFESIDIELLGGPFRILQGGWRFSDLGDDGSKVALELEFEFENALVDVMFGAYFEDICNRLVDAFTQRADAVYGDH